MDGYFKVHRKILESQVFAHQTALKIWIWCLAKVSFKERYVPLKIGKGCISVKLLPGQFIFGRFKAEEELSIDGSTIYRWIKKFASNEFNMISIESNNQYSIITICKWQEYQNLEEESEQPMSNQRATNEQPTNTYNKDNKDNKEEEEGDLVNYKKLLNEFHFYCDKLSKVERLSAERKKHVNARIKEFDYDKVIEVFKKVGKSDFLCGKNDRAWKANFDWIFNETNFLKIMEGKYENKNTTVVPQFTRGPGI